MFQKTTEKSMGLFKFTTNKTALARRALQFGKLKQTEKKLWMKFRNEPAFYFLSPQHINWALDEINTEADIIGFQKTFTKVAKTLGTIHNEILKTKEFKKLLFETEKYKIFVETQWGKNEKFVLDFMVNTLGLRIPKYQITVYIFHPQLRVGRGNGQTRSIMWGHTEDWENYSTIYLAHELAHVIIPRNIQNRYQPIMHALIELATDNELRARLSKKIIKGNGNFEIGHSDLKEARRSLINEWKTYLKSPRRLINKNIIALARHCQQKNASS